MDDDARSITTVFWLLLGLVLSLLMISVGAAWAFLQWSGFLRPGPLWPAFLVMGMAIVGALGSSAGLVVWLLQQTNR